MRSNPPHRAEPRRIHPALDSFADDCRGTLTGIVLYIGALALIGILVVATAGPLTEAAITTATELATGRIDLAGTPAGPDVLGHPEQGRYAAARRPAEGRGSLAASAGQTLGLRGAF
jgi:hypothetical protein